MAESPELNDMNVSSSEDNVERLTFERALASVVSVVSVVNITNSGGGTLYIIS